MELHNGQSYQRQLNAGTVTFSRRESLPSNTSAFTSQGTNFSTNESPITAHIPNFIETQNDVLSNAAWDHAALTSWSASIPERLDVRLGLGSGQLRSPFSCNRETFDQIITEFGFSEQILGRVKDKQSYFEHVFRGGERPSHLEIAASTYEHDAFFCLLRSEIHSRRTRCLIFLKSSDRLKLEARIPHLQLSSVVTYLDKHNDLLATQPILIFNVILSLIQARSHDFLHWRQRLYQIEARIGVSADLETLRQSKYPDIEYDLNKLNAELTGIARDIADNELSVTTTLEHARSFLRVVDIYEQERRAGTLNSRSPTEHEYIVNVPREEIHSTISRASLYAQHTKMTQEVLRSLTAALYNRINKGDTRSMKTIAVVTLFFLPATFVSAIFSTGIFNFQAGEDPAGDRVVSRYGWVYLFVTLLLTVLTLVVWTTWFLRGEKWLDAVRNRKSKRTKRLQRAKVPDPERRAEFDISEGDIE